MRTYLVLGPWKHIKVDRTAAVHDLVQFGVGAAKQHPPPMLAILLYISREIPEQIIRLTPTPCAAKEDFIHKRSAYGFLLRSGLRLPRH